MSNRHGLTDAQVLAALYNAARVQGNGFLQARPGDMTPEEAERIIGANKHMIEQDAQRWGRRRFYVDYLRGRVIKTDVAEDPLDFRLYDRDNGPGAGERAIGAMLEALTRP